MICKIHGSANNVNGLVFSKMQPEDLKELGMSFGAQILLKDILAKVSTDTEYLQDSHSNLPSTMQGCL